MYYSGGWYTFVEKRNIQTGELIWRRNFNSVQVAAIYGDVDTNGTMYVGTYIYSGVASLFKIDSANMILWRKDMEYLAFKEVSINYKKNLILGAGIKENYGYVVARKLDTGDSVFHFPVVWVPGATGNGIQSIVADTAGYFYITGYNYTGGLTQCHLRKYNYDTLTNIAVIGNESSKDYHLFQNYPNPFNPNTKINFSIPKKGLVTLKIYDILGKEIMILVNEVKPQGTYSVNFNGIEFPSGIYFYRLQVEDPTGRTDKFTSVKKMVLVK